MNTYAIRHVNTQLGTLIYIKDLSKNVVSCDASVHETVQRVVAAQQEGFRYSNTLLYPLDAPDHEEVSTQVCWQAESGQLQILREVPLPTAE